MRFRRAVRFLPVILLGAALDRLSKVWAFALWSSGNPLVSFRPARPLIPGILNFYYTQNTGAAFSLFSSAGWVLTLLTVLLVAAVLLALLRMELPGLAKWGMALIAAGGLGNLYDRIAYGYVIDFLDFAFLDFAVFNVADVLICAGVALAAVGILFPNGGKDRDS